MIKINKKNICVSFLMNIFLCCIGLYSVDVLRMPSSIERDFYKPSIITGQGLSPEIFGEYMAISLKNYNEKKRKNDLLEKKITGMTFSQKTELKKIQMKSLAIVSYIGIAFFAIWISKNIISKKLEGVASNAKAWWGGRRTSFDFEEYKPLMQNIVLSKDLVGEYIKPGKNYMSSLVENATNPKGKITKHAIYFSGIPGSGKTQLFNHAIQEYERLKKEGKVKKKIKFVEFDIDQLKGDTPSIVAQNLKNFTKYIKIKFPNEYVFIICDEGWKFFSQYNYDLEGRTDLINRILQGTDTGDFIFLVTGNPDKSVIRNEYKTKFDYFDFDLFTENDIKTIFIHGFNEMKKDFEEIKKKDKENKNKLFNLTFDMDAYIKPIDLIRIKYLTPREISSILGKIRSEVQSLYKRSILENKNTGIDFAGVFIDPLISEYNLSAQKTYEDFKKQNVDLIKSLKASRSRGGLLGLIGNVANLMNP